ncbi:valine--pyruvate transaminase [Motilimonas eburnea]|uniref:valine--pyruvate transaminase n=1 Tax=Motilimonas eburnea TaxID=1737488 RepID=UPI001E288C4F|nr:valine--pyruvate transaminase [Motilimonas eburnea]MCE2573028.1 valine--pyruvate transaminase [Motilimonas eburnea]
MSFSSFGNKFTRHSGITQLMDDLNEGIRGGDDILMLGGGNPASIPEIEAKFKHKLDELNQSGALIDALGNYDGPQGKDTFLDALATLFRETYGWDISKKNIALTNGSQNAFFYLFNLFAGKYHDGRHKKVLFPLAPEYIGYADATLDDEVFVAAKPSIEELDGGLFKYHVDFDHLEVGDDIGLICVSRPTNPTGNVVTDEELQRLDVIAREKGIPLIIDNAYGTPFPNIIFADVNPIWNDNIILCLSLSKLGLPGARCGIVIANEQTITALSNLSGIIALSPGSIGPELALPFIQDKSIIEMSEQIVKPFYQQRAEHAVSLLQEQIAVPGFRIHKPEGAIFLWLWFKDLPVTCEELYQRLKQKGVLVVPGHYFFPGLEQEWQHTHECIRMNYSQKPEDVEKGIAIIASEVNAIYAEHNR